MIEVSVKTTKAEERLARQLGITVYELRKSAKEAQSEFKQEMEYCRRENFCVACNFAPMDTGIINRHHIIPKCAGGSDEDSNKVDLCPTCHAISHALIKNNKLILWTRVELVTKINAYRSTSKRKLYDKAYR